MDLYELILVKFESKGINHHSSKYIWKYYLQNARHLFQTSMWNIHSKISYQSLVQAWHQVRELAVTSVTNVLDSFWLYDSIVISKTKPNFVTEHCI